MLKSNGENELPTLKIGDCGFARAYTNSMETNLGTPLYKAPEIYRGQKEKCSPKCDLYSVGVILYYMAIKEYPFTDDPATFRALMKAMAPCQIPDDVELDEELEDLILHLITHHEVDRLSFDEFFNHPYVVRAMECNLHASRMQMEEVEDDEYWDFEHME